MKNLKIKIEFELIPAIVLGLGVNKETGLIIMLPFVCVTIGKIKPKKHLEPISSRHKNVNQKMHDETAKMIKDAMAKQIM